MDFVRPSSRKEKISCPLKHALSSVYFRFYILHEYSTIYIYNFIFCKMNTWMAWLVCMHVCLWYCARLKLSKMFFYAKSSSMQTCSVLENRKQRWTCAQLNQKEKSLKSRTTGLCCWTWSREITDTISITPFPLHDHTLYRFLVLELKVTFNN